MFISEPDLNAKDGIYSTFLLSFPASGLYTFTVKVHTNNEAIQFSRTAVGSSIHVKKLPSQDIFFPPGKITDLSAEHTNNGTLQVSWTVPGGDYNNGSVTGYNIVSSLDINQMLDQKQNEI